MHLQLISNVNINNFLGILNLVLKYFAVLVWWTGVDINYLWCTILSIRSMLSIRQTWYQRHKIQKTFKHVSPSYYLLIFYIFNKLTWYLANITFVSYLFVKWLKKVLFHHLQFSKFHLWQTHQNLLVCKFINSFYRKI